MKGQVQPHEILPLYRGIISGELDFEFAPTYYWTGRTTTSIEFFCQDYRVRIFVDAGELDYTDIAVVPDGREGDFDYWECDLCEEDDPIDYLSDEEHLLLIKRFEVKTNELLK